VGALLLLLVLLELELLLPLHLLLQRLKGSVSQGAEGGSGGLGLARG
jgi:hypothetical protein